MKKSFSIFSFCAFVFLLFAFTNNTSTENNKSADEFGEKSFTVYVQNQSGSAVGKGVKVKMAVCDSFSCSGYGNAEYTDSDGKVTISWRSDCDVCYVYVDGKEHKGKYRDGGSYTITRK